MSPAVVMERVYDALKQQLMSGELQPGMRLDPVRLASALNASATPVRDALHRLVGERMVRYWPLEGFHAPLHSEFGLRDLYGWHLELIRSLLRQTRLPSLDQPALPESAPEDAQAYSMATFRLFGAIAQLTDNLEHRQAIVAANERLSIARLVEPETLQDAHMELKNIAGLLAGGSYAPARRALGAYHRRRIQAIPALTAAIRLRAGAER